MTKISETLNNGNKRTRGIISNLWVGIIAVVIVGGALGIGMWLGNRSTTEWMDRYEQFRIEAQHTATVYSDSMSAVVDSLVAEADQVAELADELTSEVRTLRTQATSLRRENNTLLADAREHMASLPDGCNCDPIMELAENLQLEVEVQIREIEALRVRDDLRLVEISNLRLALDTQTIRADSLETIILNMPPPRRDSKLFGLFNVSRTEAALFGTGVGLILGVVLAR